MPLVNDVPGGNNDVVSQINDVPEEDEDVLRGNKDVLGPKRANLVQNESKQDNLQFKMIQAVLK